MIDPLEPLADIVSKLGYKYLLLFFLNFSNFFSAPISDIFFLFLYFIQYKNLVTATPSSI